MYFVALHCIRSRNFMSLMSCGLHTGEQYVSMDLIKETYRSFFIYDMRGQRERNYGAQDQVFDMPLYIAILL